MRPNRLGPVNSVQEFMEALWNEPMRENSLMRLYRGQTDDWPLLPKLFRVDRSQDDIRQLEYMLMQSFKQRCLFMLPSVPEGQYDMMSLAQHHNLPTRLLDWSSNPLMALFFAVDTHNPPHPTVWLYYATDIQLTDGRGLNRQVGVQDRKSTVILQPSRHSQRVVAQAGWHTVHSLTATEDPAARVPPMNESEDAKCLTSIMIEPTKARDIKHELRNMGIHSATVYGDLTSVCREIQDDLGIPTGMRRDASKTTEDS